VQKSRDGGYEMGLTMHFTWIVKGRGCCPAGEFLFVETEKALQRLSLQGFTGAEEAGLEPC